MKIPVHLRKTRAGGNVMAFCPDLPGCAATAQNATQALALLRDTIHDYFSRDRELPLPPGTQTLTIEI